MPSAADACRWLLLLLSALLSGAAACDGSCQSSEASRGLLSLAPGDCPVTACTVQGMARARSEQAPAWPLASDRSVRRGSRIKRDFACTFIRVFPPVLVALRSQSRLRLEGRTRMLSGPSPDLSPARTLAPSACRAEDLLIRRYPAYALQHRPQGASDYAPGTSAGGSAASASDPGAGSGLGAG